MTRKTIPETFAQRLSRLRRAAGLSQSELCRAADVPLNTLQGIEQGTRLDPRWSNVCKLADALGISTEEFR